MAHWMPVSAGEYLSSHNHLSKQFIRPVSIETLSGILIVDKPAGITSHDVVNRVRRLARQRRVGHAGTLDPLATGVLVVCIGKATRLSEYLIRHDKSYRARIRLGQTTDTFDAEGAMTSQHDGPMPERNAIERALDAFRGEIEQVPPAYSAIKVEGRPIYQRARRGEKVEIGPRRVRIHHVELTSWEPPFATLYVTCSAGVYIRSLAHDLGKALGCGAHLAGLVRTRSGHFKLEQSVTLAELESAAENQSWVHRLIPMDASLPEFGALALDADEARLVGMGQAIAGPAPEASRLARLYSPEGDFVAIAEFDPAEGVWRPQKVFISDP